VAAVPTLAVAARGNPHERVNLAMLELERAMRDCYPGAKIVTMPVEETEGCNPFVFVCAQT
jgi:hypothetical protein